MPETIETPMTNPDTKALREALAKATQGPLTLVPDPEDDCFALVFAPSHAALARFVVRMKDDTTDAPQTAQKLATAKLYIAAINALPALCDRSEELDRVKAERDDAREALKPFAQAADDMDKNGLMKFEGVTATYDACAAARAALSPKEPTDG